MAEMKNLTSVAGVTETVKKLGPARAAAILGVAAFAIAGVIVLALWNQTPDYQVLYSQLSADDSGSVIQKLKDKRIPYKVSGSAISIPSEMVHETRMELAGEGLPQGGGVGFEIFDKSSFGVTEFVQKVNYRRALQGELARTVSQIKEVESARVHLAIPDKGVFLDEQKRSRASIVVKLRGGATLTQAQVSSIVHLVANSFENLKPEDVAVVDTQGRMWTRGSEEDSGVRLSSTQSEYKRAMEKDLEARVASMLEKVVGADKVVARVALDVDTRHVKRTEETFDPDGQVVRSEQRNKEKSTGSMVALGVPGVLSNMPEGSQAPAAAQSQPQSQRQDEVVNYEISKVTSHIVEPMGSVKRMSVSVLVDGTYQSAKGDDGKDVRQFVPRTEEELSRFTEMVKGAVGFSDSRGDAVTVVSTAFETVAEEAPAAEKEPIVPKELIPTVLRYLSTVVVAVLAIFFVIRPILKRLVLEPHKAPGIATSGQAGLGEGEGSELALPSGARPLADDNSVARLKGLVKENPHQIALVLKGWVKER